jgi:hypothetical protein
VASDVNHGDKAGSQAASELASVVADEPQRASGIDDLIPSNRAGKQLDGSATAAADDSQDDSLLAAGTGTADTGPTGRQDAGATGPTIEAPTEPPHAEDQDNGAVPQAGAVNTQASTDVSVVASAAEDGGADGGAIAPLTLEAQVTRLTRQLAHYRAWLAAVHAHVLQVNPHAVQNAKRLYVGNLPATCSVVRWSGWMLLAVHSAAPMMQTRL